MVSFSQVIFLFSFFPHWVVSRWEFSHTNIDFFFFFLWLHLWLMEVPGLGVEMELQLRSTQCHHDIRSEPHLWPMPQLRQHQMRSLTHWVRSGMEPTSAQTLVQVLNPLSHNGNSQTLMSFFHSHSLTAFLYSLIFPFSTLSPSATTFICWSVKPQSCWFHRWDLDWLQVFFFFITGFLISITRRDTNDDFPQIDKVKKKRVGSTGSSEWVQESVHFDLHPGSA